MRTGVSKKRNTRLALRIVIFAITLIVLFLGTRNLFKFLLTREYLKVERIFVNNNEIDLAYLKEKNIFSIDLTKLSRDLCAKYPIYRTVRLFRFLPNCIVADFVKRKAVAYVRLYRYFAVDAQGVLFSPENIYLDQGIPVILGLETKIFSPRPGTKIDSVEMHLALELIKKINRLERLRDYKVKAINASSPWELSFFMFENLEIKVGRDIDEKLTMFVSLLSLLRSEFEKIKYIDLRFKEPVIKYRDEK